jgi:glycosidase
MDPWWRGAVIYQIYPRSFADSNDDGIGDLRGIARKLDYIARLGVDAVWLCPVYAPPGADLGYDVSDHTAIAPEYGTPNDLDALVTACHARGLRVLLDLVLAHTSEAHPWFQAVRAAIPETLPLALRVSHTDWIEGGWTTDDTVELGCRAKAAGVDLVDVSSGGADPTRQRIPIGPGYLVPGAVAVR